MDIAISKIGERAFLQLDGVVDIEIKNYKISSSMHGRTELEIVFEFDSETTEFSSKASLVKRSQRNP